MRRALCLLLAATMLLVPLPAAEAATVTFDGELAVEYTPDSLVLKPGDLDAVYIMVRNLGDRRLYVQVEASRVDAPGSSIPEIINDMFILEPKGVDQVVLTIESRASLQQDPEISDVMITFRWGADATTLEGGAFRLKDPRFVNRIEYDVEDDFSDQWARILWYIVAGAVAVVLVALITIVVRRRRWRMLDPPREDPYGEGDPRRKTLMARHQAPPEEGLEVQEDYFDPLQPTRPDVPERRGHPPLK